MKKRIVWLILAGSLCGLYAPAEPIITSPTGLSDESDVALETVVQSVKETPADIVKAAGGAVSYVGDELRNTAHGVVSAFAGDTQQEEMSRQEILREVEGAWGDPNEVEVRWYDLTAALVNEIVPGGYTNGDVTEVSSFFSSIEFPDGAGAYLLPDINRLMVRNTPQRLLRIQEALSKYRQAEKEYKQVEIKAKFIEVSQSSLDQLGFTWEIQNAAVKLGDQWQIEPNQTISAGLRTAAGAFGGTPAVGSMVLTKTGWMPLRVAIDALEQASDSDTLSAPSLTTLDGQTAEIWVGEDRNVPKGFEANSSDINIHVQHTQWDSELMGVHFRVTPGIEKGDFIRLKMNPKIIDFIGYDSYQICPQAYMLSVNGGRPRYQMHEGAYPILKYIPGTGEISQFWQATSDSIAGLYEGIYPRGGVVDVNDPRIRCNPTSVNYTEGGNNPGPMYGYIDERRKMEFKEDGFPLGSVYGRLPYFRVREIDTQVVVADGSTVGLGGLVYDRLETYKDKIPVLGSIPLIGRLFRSEGERSIKRNLMIFVSASQVANNGQSKSDVALNQ